MLSEVASAPANDDEAPYQLPPPARIQELLFDAARIGRIDVIPALVQAGTDPNLRDAAGNSAVSAARSQGNEGMAARLQVWRYQ